jgi:peroxiredoxin Q/BCP
MKNRQSATSKVRTKVASAKVPSAAKTAAKKPVAKKAPTKTVVAKKASAKKAVTKKAVTKKAVTKKAVAKKTVTKKAVAGRSASTIVAAGNAAVATSSGLVAVGAAAPGFTLPDASGKPRSLASLRGGPVVLYFYPKDDTSGCTAEACDFRDNLAAFRRAGCTVLGVSPDGVKSHAKFIAKHALGQLVLLADEPDAGGTPAVCAAYGVWQQKSMYGRAYMGVVRTTYVIATDGTVAARFDKVSVTGHAAEVLETVRGL